MGCVDLGFVRGFFEGCNEGCLGVWVYISGFKAYLLLGHDFEARKPCWPQVPGAVVIG